MSRGLVHGHKYRPLTQTEFAWERTKEEGSLLVLPADYQYAVLTKTVRFVERSTAINQEEEEAL